MRRQRLLVAIAGLAVGAPAGLLHPLVFESRELSAFHIGEFFATEVYLASGSDGGAVMTIHGALNWLPAATARLLFGNEGYLYPTIALFLMAAIAAQVIFLVLVERILPRQPSLLVFMAVAGLFASQTVHYRDLGLMVSLLFLYLALQSTSKRQTIFIILTGVSAYAGLLWSWNRGLPGLVAIVLAMLVISSVSSRRKFIWGPVTAAFMVPVFAFLHPLWQPSVIVENVSLLFGVTQDTGYGWNDQTIRIAMALFVLVAAGVIALGMFLRSNPRSSDHWGQVLLWLILVGAMTKVALDRLDSIHLDPILWVLFLVLSLSFTSVRSSLSQPVLYTSSVVIVLVLYVWWPDESMTFLIAAALLSIGLQAGMTALTAVAFVVMCAATLQLVTQGISLRTTWAPEEFVENFSSGPDLSSEETWLTEQLKGESCIVDLRSTGMLNAVTGLPNCYRYGALLWVPQSKESEVIEAIRVAQPSFIVTPGPNEEPPLIAATFPGLRSWVETNYPYVDCSDTVCIRSQSPARVEQY